MVAKHNKSTILSSLLILFFLNFHAFIAIAQLQDIKFDYLNTLNGLSSNRVMALCRDSKGFLWIGTQAGLNRFDGYSTVTFQPDSTNLHALSHENITGILEDRKKRLWISTQNGLNLYNPLNESFQVYRFISKNDKGLVDPSVTSVYEDNVGEIWVTLGKNGGFSKFDEGKNIFINFRVPKQNDNAAYNSTTYIQADKNNTLWIASLGNGLICFQPATKKFEIIEDMSINMGLGTIKKIYVDYKNTIWILTQGKGLFSYHPESKAFKQYPINETGTGTNGNLLRIMAPFDKNHLFFGIDQGGINSLNLETDRFEYIKFDDLQPRTLSNNGVWTMLKDKEGILWVGTSAGGISYYNPKKERFKHFKHYMDPASLSYNAILCFHEDKEGKIWIGTDGGGLNIFDPVKSTFSTFKYNPNDPNSIGSNVILSIDEDKTQNVWMGSWAGGLLRYNRGDKKFYRYHSSETDPATIGSDNIWSVNFDTRNNLWISNLDYGIDVFNVKSGFKRIFPYDPINPKPKEFFRLNVFYKGRNNKIWIARSGTLSTIDTLNNRLLNFKVLPFTSIFCLYEDLMDRIWVGTNNKGIYCLNKQGEIIQTLNKKNGLPHNTVSGILEDNHDNLWIATNAGICKYNKTSKLLINYPQNDGLQSNNYKEWAYIKSKTGNIYFGGYNGFNTFHPDSIKNNDYLPYVYINEFQLFGKTVKIGDADSILHHSIAETRKLRLKSSMSVFSFSFAAVSYTNPENNRYSYKLDGFDKQWNYTTASRRYVTYTNLDPGKYVFRLKASNNDGLWNENGVTLEIEILPPFWKTWWFRILFLLIAGISLLGYFQYRETKLKRYNLELESRVAERTTELSLVNEDLLEKHDWIMAQNEEISAQNEEILAQSQEIYNKNEEISIQKELLEEQKSNIEQAYQELTKYRTQLEELVEERTGELIVAKEKAEESDRLKSSFLSNLSHEIRTPLNAIIGFSGMLLDPERTSDERDSFDQIIRRSSDTLLCLINDVIDFSKIEAGHIEIYLADIPVSKIVNQVHDIFSLEFKKQLIGTRNEIEFRVVVPDNLCTLILQTDEIRLMQIITNLINNAIKFTQHGFVEFGCKEYKGGRCIEFYVKDTGIGIKKEHLNLIFQRFRKVEDDINQIYRGAGLGLAISSELIHLLGGQIFVSSEPEKGSVFTFNVPVKEVEFIELKQTVKQLLKQSYDFGGVNILVAEDDFTNFLFLERLLKKTGATIYHAQTGKQAVMMTESNPDIQVILMDIKMPEMDGIEALKVIRQTNKTIPVIAQTAYALSQEITKLKEAGFDNYITKPIHSAELYNMLEVILLRKE